MDSSSVIVLSSGDEEISDENVLLLPAPKCVKLEVDVSSDNDDNDGDSDICGIATPVHNKNE